MPASQKDKKKSVSIEETKFSVDELVISEVAKRMGELDVRVTEQISKIDILSLIDIDQIVNRVVEQVGEKRSKSEAPAFAKMDAEAAYQQCFERALDISVSGQSLAFMGAKSNTKAIMAEAIKLTNRMFECLVEEFDIST